MIRSVPNHTELGKPEARRVTALAAEMHFWASLSDGLELFTLARRHDPAATDQDLAQALEVALAHARDTARCPADVHLTIQRLQAYQAAQPS